MTHVFARALSQLGGQIPWLLKNSTFSTSKRALFIGGVEGSCYWHFNRWSQGWISLLLIEPYCCWLLICIYAWYVTRFIVSLSFDPIWKQWENILQSLCIYYIVKYSNVLNTQSKLIIDWIFRIRVSGLIRICFAIQFLQYLLACHVWNENKHWNALPSIHQFCREWAEFRY